MVGAIQAAIGAVTAYFVFTDARSRGCSISRTLLWTAGCLALPELFVPAYLLIGRNQNMAEKIYKIFKPTVQESIQQQFQQGFQQKTDAHTIEVVAEDVIRCRGCGCRVQEDFKNCPQCRRPLKYPCCHCQRQLNDSWRVCPYCQTANSGP